MATTYDDLEWSIVDSSHIFCRWNEECPGRSRLTPKQWCFPGSCNSGAFQRPLFDVVNASAVFAAKTGSAEEKEALTGFTVAQPETTVYAQLVNGCRFLDLRFSYLLGKNDKFQYYLLDSNDYPCSELRDALDDLVRFLSESRGELVLLQLTPIRQVDERHAQDYVSGYPLSRFLFRDKKGDGSMNETVAQMTKRGAQVIAVWRGAHVSCPLFFRSAGLISDDAIKSEHDVACQQSAIRSALAEHVAAASDPYQGMYRMDYTLTEKMVDDAGALVIDGSLRELAAVMNPTLDHFFNRQLSKDLTRFVNIIACNDQRKSSNVLLAISIIADRTEEQGDVTLARAYDMCGFDEDH